MSEKMSYEKQAELKQRILETLKNAGVTTNKKKMGSKALKNHIQPSIQLNENSDTSNDEYNNMDLMPDGVVDTPEKSENWAVNQNDSIISKEMLRSGVLISEIIGEPICKKRFRRRNER